MSSLMMLASTVPAVLLGDGSFWLPPPDSTTAPAMDSVFYLILSVCAFFFFLVVALHGVLRDRLSAAAWAQRRRRRPRTAMCSRSPGPMIPMIIVAYIFYAGFSAYMEMKRRRRTRTRSSSRHRKWDWFFTYPNGHVDSDLHVPVNEPVKLIMSSDDVIHSLSIPDVSREDGLRSRPLHVRLVSGDEARHVRSVLHRILRRQPLQHAGECRRARTGRV